MYRNTSTVPGSRLFWSQEVFSSCKNLVKNNQKCWKNVKLLNIFLILANSAVHCPCPTVGPLCPKVVRIGSSASHDPTWDKAGI